MAEHDESIRLLLRARLRELVAAAEPGERLPGERDLCARWGVARMTLRHAMDTLVAEGLLERRQGSGTYVAPNPAVRILGLTSFTQDMRERGLIPGSRLVAFEVAPADGTTAGALRIPLGAPVVGFTRLRTGSGEPMALETVRIPAALVPGLARGDLAGSLYELLAKRYGIVTGSATVRIEPVLPDARSRELLGIGPEQACLRLRMVDADPDGRTLMLADCLYRGDRYQLSATVGGAAYSSVFARRAG